MAGPQREMPKGWFKTATRVDDSAARWEDDQRRIWVFLIQNKERKNPGRGHHEDQEETESRAPQRRFSTSPLKECLSISPGLAQTGHGDIKTLP